MRDLLRSMYLTSGVIQLGSRDERETVRKGMHQLICFFFIRHSETFFSFTKSTDIVIIKIDGLAKEMSPMNAYLSQIHLNTRIRAFYGNNYKLS